MANSSSSDLHYLHSDGRRLPQAHVVKDPREFIVVKLTDSAHSAIEEYQRNQSIGCFENTNQRATIQFVGNSGVIKLPTPIHTSGGDGGYDGCKKFEFSIDAENSSLECIKQTLAPYPRLEIFGLLPHRMRIHGNEDVYDETRTKMAIAQEAEKSKRVQEIKPSHAEIGRDAKIRRTSRYSV